MDLVERSAFATKNKSRMARTISKVLHVRAVTGIAPDDDLDYKIKPEYVRDNLAKKTRLESFKKEDEKLRNRAEAEDEKLKNKAETEAFLARLFASLSVIKAAYSQLQFAQSPYDPDGIQTADQMVVSELKNLSKLKHCFSKKEFSEACPEKAQLSAEIHEQKSLIRMYEVMGKKFNSDVKLKDSEITFLKEKLEEANRENCLLEKRSNSSGQISVVDHNLCLSGLGPSHFIAVLRQGNKSIRSFVSLLVSEMENADWDLDAAANSIERDVVYWKSSDICYTFESFVCREMFDGFNHPEFKSFTKEKPKNRKELFFERFKELKSVKPMDYLAWKPKSTFSRFCRAKYLRLVHPKMELSLFGNLDQRNMVNAGEFPETTFFIAFAEMAKRVWMLHCLAFSFEPEASIYQVRKRSPFSEVYMESVNEEPFISSKTEPPVGFTVVPGFRIGKTAIQCQVYLC